jgi:hypothetical protein
VSLADIADNVRRGIGAAEQAAETLLNFAKGSVTDPVSTWQSAAETLMSVSRFTAMPDGPLSPLLTQRGTTYRFAGFDLPFNGLRGAAKSRGRSVNDAFMAAVGLGFERYHVRHGMVADELRFNVPISLRVLAQAALASDVTTSNVPGPPIPLYVAGERIVGMYPLVATIGAAANVTMVTYDGSAFVGLAADERAVPDLDALVADLRSGFATVTGEPVGAADPLVEPGAQDGTPKARAVREAG